MFNKIKDFLFGSSPVQSPVATPEAVVPAGVVEQAPAVETGTVAKPKKPPVVKKPRAPKAK